MSRSVVRIAVQIAVVALLVAAVFVVVGPVRREFDRRFDLARHEAVTHIERLLGRRVSFTSVSPSILRFLNVRDLTIHGTADEPADLLTVQSLRIYYRPLRLLQGRYAEAFSEIRIENTALTLDIRSGGAAAIMLSDVLGGGGIPHRDVASVLPDDMVISGRNIQLRLRSELGLIETERLFFSTSLAESVVTLRIQGDARLTEPRAGFPLPEVAGYVTATGTVDTATGDTLLEVAFPHVSSDLVSLRGQVLQVRYADGVLEARNVQSRDPVDIYVRYIDSAGELYARILADGYHLDDLVRFDGVHADLNRLLALPIRGQASLTMTPDTLSFGGSLLTQISDFPDVPSGELTLRFEGDRQGATIDELRYVTSMGAVDYRGRLAFDPLRPDGVITLRDVTYGGIRPLSISATLSTTHDAVSVTAGRFSYAGSVFSALRGSVMLTDTPTAELTVELGAAGTSRLEIRTEHAPDGTLQRAQVDARGVAPDKLVEIQRAVAPALDLPDLSAIPTSVVVDSRIFLDLSDGLWLDVPLFYAYESGPADDYISFSLRYSQGTVDVRDLTASYGGYRGRGDVKASIENGGSIRFSSDVVVEDIPYRFTGRYRPDNSLEIQGLHDVDARFYFGERGEIIFRASGDLPLPVLGTDAGRFAFAAEGYYFTPDDWSVSAHRFAASGIPYPLRPDDQLTVDLGVAGVFTPAGAKLSSVTYSDAFSSLSGAGELAWNLRALSGALALSLSGGDGESYTVDLAYDGGTVEATADFASLPLLRLGVETVRGALSGRLEVNGSVARPAVSASVELVNGKFNNDTIEAFAVVEIDERSLRLIEGSGRYARSRAQGLSGLLSFEDGTLLVAGTLVQQTEQGPISIGLDGGGSFGSFHELADAVTSDFAGAVVITGVPVREDIPAEWTFRIDRTADVISASGGPLEAVSVSLRPDGSFRGRVAAPLPLRFDTVGIIEAGTIEADLTNVWGDVERLWYLAESPDFVVTGGTATGSVRIVGPLNDPDFYGTLIAESVTARMDILADQIGPARLFLVFDEKILSVRETSVRAGNGRARVGVEATMDRWLPEEYRVNVVTEDNAALRIAYDFDGVVADGLAGGWVQIDGAPGTTRVTGAVTASSMVITLSDVTEQPVIGDAPVDLSVDLSVRTGRGVEFRWPTSAFPILRGFAAVGESLRITHESASGAFSVAGGISIQGGEVFYFDRSFYIREGRITFDEDETRFDPRLTVNAEIREVADEGPVRIYLVAEERPLSEFTPRWRSDPPLSEAAIIALLGGSVFVGEGGGPLDLSDAVLLTSDVVSQFGIIRGFESSVRDALQLDLFSIRTQLFQNLLRGVIDQNTYPLDNAVPSLGQYLDNTTLFVGKYLGADLFMELLVQLRSTQVNGAEPRSLAGIEVESEFSLEWQTPFFVLEWSFFPRDPSSLFLADNTITFSWEFSY